MRRPFFTSQRFRILLWGFLAVLGLSAVAVGSYSRYILGKIQYIDPTATSMLSQEALDHYTEAGDRPIPEDTPLAPYEIILPTQEALETEANVINILLIGQDRQSGEVRARSDTILLCTLDTREKTLTMTSFLRDLYVAIPGYRSNRINAAYTAGGMALLDQTLETNFGITVDGNIAVDFQQFPQIIDLLGGVSLELRQDEADHINTATGSQLSAGTHLLNGSQALAYTRIRKLDADGDFSRTNRQRKLLEALLNSYRSTGTGQLLSLLEALLPMVTTDMTQEMLASVLTRCLPILPQLEVRTQYIPEEGTYSYRKIRGMSVLVADMDKARDLLKKTISPPRSE